MRRVYFHTKSGWIDLARGWLEKMGCTFVEDIKDATLIIVEASLETLDKAFVRLYRGKVVVIAPANLRASEFKKLYATVYDLGALDCRRAHDNGTSFGMDAQRWF